MEKESWIAKNISRKRFVSLVRKDNIVIFKTLRYSEQPLVVKGAGAGAEVTASGVLQILCVQYKFYSTAKETKDL